MSLISCNCQPRPDREACKRADQKRHRLQTLQLQVYWWVSFQNEARVNDNLWNMPLLWKEQIWIMKLLPSVRINNLAGCSINIFTPTDVQLSPKNMLTTFFNDRLWTGGRGNVSRDDKDVCWFQFDFTIPHPVRRKSQTSWAQGAWWLLFNHFHRPCTGSANKNQSLCRLAVCFVYT